MAQTALDITDAGGSQYTVENWAGAEGVTMFVTEFETLSALAEFEDDNAMDGTSWLGSFEGLDTLADHRDAVRAGDAPNSVFDQYVALRDRLDPMVQELVARMPSAKRVRRMGIEGSELSTERVMVHDTDVWETRKRGAQRETVRIGLNFGYNAGTSAAEFIEGAVRGVALADVLQALGHTVEITACTFGKHDASRYATHTNPRRSAHYAILAAAKASTQPLDAKLLLCTALPAMFRVMGFGVLNTYADRLVQDAKTQRVRVRAEHVEQFGLDVFVTGHDCRFVGDNTESAVAEAARAVADVNWHELSS